MFEKNCLEKFHFVCSFTSSYEKEREIYKTMKEVNEVFHCQMLKEEIDTKNERYRTELTELAALALF